MRLGLNIRTSFYTMQPSIAYVKVDAVDDKPGVWIVSRNLVILTSAIPQLERANGLKGK